MIAMRKHPIHTQESVSISHVTSSFPSRSNNGPVNRLEKVQNVCVR